MVPVRPHSPRGGDVIGIVDLAGPAELRALRSGYLSLQGRPLLDELTLVICKRTKRTDQ